MLVGPQRVMLLDEISTGLDASTTRMVTQALRNVAHMTQVRSFPCFVSIACIFLCASIARMAAKAPAQRDPV